MKFAVCYFGLLRTLKKTFSSHLHIFNKLKEQGIEIDIYVHTWYGSFVHLRGNNKQIYSNDLNDINLIHPHKFAIDNQDEFIQTIHFPDYFYLDVFQKYGESRSTEWFPDLILFHLCSLESQRRVIEMVEAEKKEYTKIIMMRPDILFEGEFPIHIFFDASPMKIFLPSHGSGEGYNDQFAIFNANDIQPYKNRIYAAKEYRSKVGRIVGEKYLKYILDTNGFVVIQTEIPFTLLRE